jgi:hypothetical protein
VIRRAFIVTFLLGSLIVPTLAQARFSTQVIIKNAPQAPGRYFDPHNHFNGVIPYRLFGGITATGQREIDVFLKSPHGAEIKRLLPASDDQQARVMILEFLGHHTLTRRAADGGRVQVAKPEVRKEAQLYKLLDDLENRLMKLLWQELQAARTTLTSSEERMAVGAQTLRQFLACEPADDPKSVKHLLQSVLTANPQNDFEAVYVARGLIKMPSLRAQLEATLNVLAHDQIGYVEMSQPITKFFVGSADKKTPPSGFLAEEVKTTLLKAESAGGPQLRWLPMLLTGMLADDGHGKSVVLSKESGQCENSGPDPAPMLKPLQPDSDGKSQLERVLAEPMVVGFDMASPERSCFTKSGARHFAEALAITFRAAQAESKRLVAHVHVGEGFPVFVTPSGKGTGDAGNGSDVSCENPKAPREMQPLQIKYQGNLPVHFINAENNIEVLLDSVEAFRKELKGEVARFDDYVEVRFGHVTHANLRQARRMRELHIFADVNLTSNLATGALTLHGFDVGFGYESGSYRPLAPGDLKRLAENPESARLFKDHSLITLLVEGVSVMLGTDGGGVEHSTMVAEYALAGTIIDAAWEGFGEDRFELVVNDSKKVKLNKRLLSSEELAWMKQAVSLKRLYENQQTHYRFISSPPGTTSRWRNDLQAQKIWKILDAR